MAVVEGVADLDRELRRLNKKVGPQIARKTTNSAGRSFVTGIRRKVPKTTTPGHSQKRLKSAVTYRANKKRRTELTAGKVGFLRRRKAPHAHLFILGTKTRTRRRIGGKFAHFDNGSNRSTGAARNHDQVVPSGVATSINRARRNMERTAKREVQKQRKRRRR